MADTKISNLTAYTQAISTDRIPIVDITNTTTKYITWADFFKSPTLVTPALGTPSALVLTNATGLPAASVLAGSFGAGAFVMSSSLQVVTIELGHATDTTIARVSAGVISVEGARVITSAGTTSGTILKNNGTTFVASTETYANPGNLDNVLKSDGTNWTAVPYSKEVTMFTAFESSTRFTTVNVNTGATGFGDQGFNMTTGGTAGSSSRTLLGMAQGANDDITTGSPSFTCKFNIATLGTTGDAFVGIGAPTVAGTGITFTVRHAGFKVIITGSVASLYATQADGTTELASSALTTIAVGDEIEVFLKFNGTSSIDYYWRKNGGAWSSATNLATNLPTSTTTKELNFSITNQSTATTNNIYCTCASYRR